MYILNIYLNLYFIYNLYMNIYSYINVHCLDFLLVFKIYLTYFIINIRIYNGVNRSALEVQCYY